MKRILLVFVMTAFLIAVALGGTALAERPEDKGCEGIVKAVQQQETHRPGGANIVVEKDVAKAHSCDVKGK